MMMYSQLPPENTLRVASIFTITAKVFFVLKGLLAYLFCKGNGIMVTERNKTNRVSA